MIEEIIQKLSLGGGFLWPLVIIVLFYVGYDLYTDYKVSRLGAFAPRIKTYLPLSELGDCGGSYIIGERNLF